MQTMNCFKEWRLMWLMDVPPHMTEPSAAFGSKLGPARKHTITYFLPSLLHFPFPLILTALESHPYK